MVFVCSPLGIRNIDKVGVMISFGGRIKINNSQTAPDYFALLSAEIASLIAASSLELFEVLHLVLHIGYIMRDSLKCPCMSIFGQTWQ